MPIDAPARCLPSLSPAAALFRALGDRSPLALLSGLTQGEARVVDLTRELGLACLRDCGFISGRAEGRQVFYACP